jgi:hypothetical protein
MATPLELSKDGITFWNKHDDENLTSGYTAETDYIHPEAILKARKRFVNLSRMSGRLILTARLNP